MHLLLGLLLCLLLRLLLYLLLSLRCYATLIDWVAAGRSRGYNARSINPLKGSLVACVDPKSPFLVPRVACGCSKRRNFGGICCARSRGWTIGHSRGRNTDGAWWHLGQVRWWLWRGHLWLHILVL